ncbi:MAG: G-D-S-L family lipolytic protein [Goleter apudmare HA4340-LM2]|jgi:lysophospholipase L1-like esterase|nr:G-D-S-L family lipolytic protein [Goleter apudmare HA4340-LM2]
MNNRFTIILFISVLLNIFFLLLINILIVKKGGHEYLLQKVSSLWSGVLVGEPSHNYSVYYYYKQSQFQILPKSNADIIFLGDSITDEGEWIELMNNSQIKNRGINGDTTDGILNRLQEIVESQPRKVFLMVGVNDLVFKHKSVEQILKTYKQILNEFQIHAPNTQLFIQSILPVNNKKQFLQNNNNILTLNLGLSELAREFKYQYIDVFSHLSDSENKLDVQYTLDGLHLNGQGYLIWKKVIEKYVI